MDSFLQESEHGIRLGFFLGVLVLMAAWEVASPRRRLTQSKAVRWYSNLGIVALNSLLVRLVFPTVPIAVAVIASDKGWGVLNIWNIPPWAALIAAVVVLDFAIYLQHVMVHAVPVLWRIHRMHHADQDFDVTTGLRFHPFEILLSIVIKFAVIILIGAPALAVLVFEILLNATAMFNHGNVMLPAALDRVLRPFVVTPDMHRVHHSIIPSETNSNFGFNLSIWDRLMGTYRAQPEKGHNGMTIGIEMFRTSGDQHLHRMLIQPFRDHVGEYAINRRDGGHPR